MKTVKTAHIFSVLLLTSFIVWPMRTASADETAELKKQIEVLTNRIAQLEGEMKQREESAPAPGSWGIQHWDPSGEIQRIQSEMNRLFQESMSHVNLPRVGGLNNFDLRFDTAETKTHYVYTFDIPGMNKESIKVDVRDRMLTISGERSKTMEENNGQQVRRSRSFGTFSKTISLPPDSSEDEIVAGYDKGVLTVKVGRKPNKPVPKPTGKAIKVN